MSRQFLRDDHGWAAVRTAVSVSILLLVNGATFTLANAGEFHFGIIANSSQIKQDEAILQRAIIGRK